jgi:hypothetical protein
MITTDQSIAVEPRLGRGKELPCFGPLCLLTGGLSALVRPVRSVRPVKTERRQRDQKWLLGMILCSQPLS